MQRLCLVGLLGITSAISVRAADPPPKPDPFRRDNLVAWCIVPFDAKKRGPQERVEMLARLGFRKYAYDWRAEHLPTFDEELRLLKRHGIELTAVWFPTALNDDAKTLLSLLEKHQVKTQLWVTGGGGPTNSPEEQRQRVIAEANRIRPIAEAADRIGCTVALYNHGGWFGEPENQLAVLAELKRPNVGLVYNQHHGHDHVDRFAALLKQMQPHLWTLNLNGMVPDGERSGQKIVPLGAGSDDLRLLKLIRESDYSGRIGILGHTNDDAEERLRDNLDGLDWLLRHKDGQPPEPLPKYRTYTPPAPPKKVSAAPPTKPPLKNHWGKEEVGFDWTEQDSIDGRWSQTDVGPFLATRLPLPGVPPVKKGLSIKLGDDARNSICYDTEHCTWRAAWTGGFLKFDPARYGLIGPPKMAGDELFVALEGPGWRSGENSSLKPRHRGLRLCGDRVVLESSLGSMLLRETPSAATTTAGTIFTRDVEVAGDAPELWMQVSSAGDVHEQPNPQSLVVGINYRKAVIVASAEQLLEFQFDQLRQALWLRIPASAQPRRFRVSICETKNDDPSKTLDAIAKLAPFDWTLVSQPAKPRWTEPIVTKGVRSADTAAYVVDTLTIPFDNRYRALFFVSGFDFLPNGDLAVCTAHGDVWIVRGVDERLEHLEWRRFATGLFQPLGLKVVDGDIHVLGRDQITILRDSNRDGEADLYENFCNSYETSFGGHDYVTCLEIDSHGNFYFLHANQGLVRVSPNGKKVETVATGFRNPNGLGIGPNDVITVSPQEGEWTPASSICLVRPGGHYGYLGPKPADERPLGYDPPLCWIPRAVDNSSGGQVWAGENWGPLSGLMLHLSFGQCRVLPVLRETVDGVVQGATVASSLVLESGVMRGRVSPHDGQVYLSGMRGWVTSAVQDGSLQRVRYTGQPAGVPVGWTTYANGLSIQFSEPLDAEWAEDPGNYRVQRWDYIYRAAYGSPEYQDAERGIEGRVNIEVRSATRSADGRSVFLELNDLRPAMQYAVTGNIARADGEKLAFAVYPTIHRVPARMVPESEITRRAQPGRLPAELVARLRPGVRLEFAQAERSDERVGRLAAWHVPVDEAPSLRLSPGPFRVRASGWIQAPSREGYRFRIGGRGPATLFLRGREVWSGDGNLDDIASAEVELPAGDHPFMLEYQSPSDAAATARLMWSSDSFAEEPVPPTALWHDSGEPALQASLRWREGHWLFREYRCANCHGPTESTDLGPDLTDIGARVTPEWIAVWLTNPHVFRAGATMPSLFGGDPQGRQAAADVAKFLSHARQTPVADAPGSPLSGEALWEELGCIVCHRFTAGATATRNEKFGRVSLSAANAKFAPGQLVEFLQQPQRHWPTTPMPDFHLSTAEAEALAAWIAMRSNTKVNFTAEWRTADAERGRRHVDKLQCRRCHRLGDKAAAAPIIAIRSGNRGCLAEGVRARGHNPAFAFSTRQRSALCDYVNARPEAAPHVVVEDITWLVRHLNCRACHHRDHDLSPRGEILSEESERGLPPESWPNLTWAGEKLHGKWLRPFLAGELAERPRPWLKGRMPAFPAYAEVLTRGLLSEHGWPVGWDESASPTNANARPSVGLADSSHPTDVLETGRSLTLAVGGLDCRQCHGIAGDLPAGDERTRLARGVDFLVMRDRLRDEHYLRFVLDPPRFDIATRMPKLAVDGKSTKITSIYDGDARKQFNAIWRYVQSLEK